MALFLSRAVGKEGCVHTYDIRPEFSENAKKNVLIWNEIDNVSYFQGDLATANLQNDFYDGIVLDMLQPWVVLQNLNH